MLTGNEKLQLGEWMLAQSMITADQLAIALIEQQKSGLPLGQQLVRLHFVTDAMVRDIMAQHHAQESIDLQQVIPDPEVLAMVPEAHAKQYRLIPLDISPDKQVMRVAMADINRITALDQLRYLLGGSIQLKPVLATEAHIEQALDRFYGHHLSLDDILHEIEQEALPQMSGISQQDTRPVIRLVNAILIDAVKQGASDIHFEPEQAFLRIRYRIDGVLWQIRCLHDRYWPAMCVRLKILAGMDIAEQRTPQDGRVNLFLCGSQIDFRVSSHPTLHGENIVLRVLDRDKAIIALDAMGLRQPQLQLLKTMLEKPEGLLILTGPTGSGKTTTLYSLLGHLNHQHVNIMTLEDPVEYPYMLMRQTSVNEATKVDFVTGIRAILRQDPDIILVGEVRDEPTAAMAIRAAMTGHLVMTTLHTNNAIAAFARLEDLGINRQVMAGSLVGVIAQRLLRRLCPYCKVPVLPDMEMQALLEALPVWESNASIQLYQAGGCKQCRMSGYRGRLVIMEILAMYPDLDAMLQRHPAAMELQQQARKYGYTTLAEEGLQRVRAGDTSLQELRRVVDLSVYIAGMAE